jgi:putative transposase
MAQGPLQLELRPRTWGGKRPGAGRKPSGARVGVPHRPRPPHYARHPLHVTLRARRGLLSLRTDALFPHLRRGLAEASRWGFRVLHFSVQRDHIHLLVEAADGCALSRGLQGLAIRLAKAVNRAVRRRGRVWGDRYHARELRTPREVRNALVYVLQNWRKHLTGARGMDSRSSAPWFEGWTTSVQRIAASPPVVAARTWLAAVGWRRLGLIRPDEEPRRGPRSFGTRGSPLRDKDAIE